MSTEVISKNKSYITGTRLPFVSASVLPAILGSVWCWVYGSEFYLLNAILEILGVFFLHLGANTLNDYFDWDESDKINRFPTPFSGGSRSRLENILTRNSFLYMSIPIAIKTSKHIWKHHADPVAIIPAQAGTIQFQILSAVIVIASLIAEKFI